MKANEEKDRRQKNVKVSWSLELKKQWDISTSESQQSCKGADEDQEDQDQEEEEDNKKENWQKLQIRKIYGASEKTH